MSFLRVTTGGSPQAINDLGVTIPATTTDTLSDRFSIADLYLSADLEALVIASTITMELDYGTGFTTIAAGDYTNRDALATFLNAYELSNENNNEDLVDGSEVNTSGPGSTPLHIHDLRYYTETEMGNSGVGTSGAAKVGVDPTSMVCTASTDLQTVLQDLCTYVGGATDLDEVYTNDSDGIMHVNGTTKPLILRSNNVNDINIDRDNLTNQQSALLFDVDADELILGALAIGALAQIDVHILSNLVVDGNIDFTGTITDTTVDKMNVTNASIRLREGAATGANAQLQVERGSTGADAQFEWNEGTDRWQVGIVGSMYDILLAHLHEDITGVWSFGGADDTEPDMHLIEKSDTTPPASELGGAGEIPMAMMENGILAVYDKSNSRDKWLSVGREFMHFAGRDNANNKDEYARTCGAFTSNQTGNRLKTKATLVGMTIQTVGVETWNARVRKNGSASNLATLNATAVAGNQVKTLNVDFAAGDEIQVFIDSAGASIDRPFIKLEFAELFSA